MEKQPQSSLETNPNIETLLPGMLEHFRREIIMSIRDSGVEASQEKLQRWTASAEHWVDTALLDREKFVVRKILFEHARYTLCQEANDEAGKAKCMHDAFVMATQEDLREELKAMILDNRF